MPSSQIQSSPTLSEEDFHQAVSYWSARATRHSMASIFSRLFDVVFQASSTSGWQSTSFPPSLLGARSVSRFTASQAKYTVKFIHYRIATYCIVQQRHVSLFNASVPQFTFCQRHRSFCQRFQKKVIA